MKSFSFSSRESQALAILTCSSHELKRVDLPYPAGAEIKIKPHSNPLFIFWTRRGLTTSLERSGGMDNLVDRICIAAYYSSLCISYRKLVRSATGRGSE